MSVMRNFKDRVRTMGSNATSIPLIPGPEVENIKSIIDRTGYQMEITVGQRKYHCPPNIVNEPNGTDHEVIILLHVNYLSIIHLFRSILDKSLEIFMKINLFHSLKTLELFWTYE